MLADTPLPNCAVYWMLFTPVSVLLPPSRLRVDVARKTVPGRRSRPRTDLPKVKPANWMKTILDRDVAAAGRIEQLRAADRGVPLIEFGL